MSKATTSASDRGWAVMYMRLHSAFRTAIACIIVGCTTLYGPTTLKQQVTFPAFSYVTAVLIVSDDHAYFGEAMRGCWHALCATFQVVPLAMLSIWGIGLTRFTPPVATAAVGVLSFLVALPKSTDLMCKRLAFGQIVIVYVDAVIHRRVHELEEEQSYHATTHPQHVAASTALGALSALLALLLPYPRLALQQVRKHSEMYGENASERMNLYMNALNADKPSLAVELLKQVKPLNEAGNKVLRTIMLSQAGLMWERRLARWMRLRSFSRTTITEFDRLQGIETQLRGMEIALKKRSSLSSHGDRWATNNQEDDLIKEVLLGASTLISLKLQQARCFLPSSSATLRKLETQFVDKLKLPHNIDPSASFFLSCVQQIINDTTTSVKIPDTVFEKSKDVPKEIYHVQILQWFSGRFLFALKCSLSLSLAVISGLTFNKENSYWSGLTIAIGFVEGSQPLFTMSNARAQGTAIGSVYGVLGCFVFRTFPEIRCLALLPWIFFTSFLRHSCMYGQAGGISAVIGALLILGRNNYGLPDEFAIYRLTEAIIGLCCYILVEILIQPNRASTLVKKHVYLSLVTLQECLQQLTLSTGHQDIRLPAFKQKLGHLTSLVQDLDNFIKQAELEPDFSLLPFQGSTYKKVHNSLSNMVNLLSCLYYSIEYRLIVAEHEIAPCKEIQQHIDNELDHCKETISCSLRCLQNVCQKSQEKGFHKKEKGKSWIIDIEQPITSASSLLEQSKKVQESLEDDEGDEEDKGKMLLSLSVWGFCTGYLMRETKTIDRLIKDLIHWE